MARILIAYASRYGQTKKIADHVFGALLTKGHAVTLVDCVKQTRPQALLAQDAFILAAPILYGKHEKALARFVTQHLMQLGTAPSALLSVSGSAASGNQKGLDEAQAAIESFIQETGFRPNVYLPVAGAIKFTSYPWLVRWMMRRIVRKTGGQHSGDTDPSRDYEYTDWNALDRFVDDFMRTHVTPQPTTVKEITNGT